MRELCYEKNFPKSLPAILEIFWQTNYYDFSGRNSFDWEKKSFTILNFENFVFWT